MPTDFGFPLPSRYRERLAELGELALSGNWEPTFEGAPVIIEPTLSRPRLRIPPSRVDGPNVCTAQEWFDELPHLEEPINDGVHTLTVTSIEGRSKSWTMHVAAGKGRAEIALGPPGRARNRRMRILLGRTDIDLLDDIREALVGKEIRVRLTSYRVGGGREFRGIERAT
jgi:hypothetical protein